MKRIFVGIHILFFLSLPFIGVAQITEDPIKAWIELDLTEDGDAKVRALFSNNTNQSLTLFYRLKVVRSGKTGTATNAQSGEFNTLPNEVKELSKVDFYTGSRDYYKNSIGNT